MLFPIEVRNISKTYTHKSKSLSSGISDGTSIKKVLDNISFKIQKGQVCGIIGANGSGKSTLLKIISGILKPDSGEVEVEGKVAAILELGTGFHPELTGRDNIVFNAVVLGFKKQHVRSVIDEIISFSELGEYIDLPVKTYSSGMYMRLAFSIVVHLQADILLLDEVFSVGDPEFRLKCMEKLFQLRDSDTTILLVSHDFHQVSQLCSRCILLKDGRINIDGQPEAVIDHYVATFFEKIHKTGKENTTPVNVWEDRNNMFIKRMEVTSLCSFIYHRSDPVTIHFHFEKSGNEALFVSFVLFYRFDDIALASSTVYNQDYSPPGDNYAIASPGNYKVKATIPPHLLNIGKYMLGLYVVDNDGHTVLTVNNLCMINIVNDPSSGESRTIESLPSHFPIFTMLDWEIVQETMG